MATKSKAELLKELKKLSKKADRRLRNLEKLSKEEEFSGVLNWAYKRAARDAKTWGTKTDNPRFDIRPPEDIQKIEAKIADIEEFLSMKTSTKRGIKSMYREEAQAAAKEAGMEKKGDWQIMAAFYEKKLNDAMDDYGYRTYYAAIKTMRENRAAYQKAKRQHRKIVIRGNDEFETRAIQDLIKNHAKDLIAIGLWQ